MINSLDDNGMNLYMETKSKYIIIVPAGTTVWRGVQHEEIILTEDLTTDTLLDSDTGKLSAFLSKIVRGEA